MILQLPVPVRGRALRAEPEGVGVGATPLVSGGKGCSPADQRMSLGPVGASELVSLCVDESSVRILMAAIRREWPMGMRRLRLLRREQKDHAA